MFISLVLLVLNISLRTTPEQLHVLHRKNSRDPDTPQETRSVVEYQLPESAAQAETDDRGDQCRPWSVRHTGECAVRLTTDWIFTEIFLLWSDRISELNSRTVSVWIIYLQIHQKDPTQNSFFWSIISWFIFHKSVFLFISHCKECYVLQMFTLCSPQKVYIKLGTTRG